MAVQLSAVKAKVWLLHLQSSGSVVASLSLDVIREICSYIEDPLFAALYNQTLALYDFSTHNTTQHALPIDVRSGYIQVDRTTVLIVDYEVLTLDLLTLHITPLAPLLTPRNYVGVVLVGNTVFAFGGFHGESPLTVCEKCSVPLTHWTQLPSMHYARSDFTPCAYKALLYLVSTAAEDHRTVESFSPHNETFTVLAVSLPEDLELGWASVAFVANGELLLLTGHRQMARWRIESEAHFRVSATSRGCFSFHSPLIVGIEVYIANTYSERLEKWSLETERFVFLNS